MVKTKRQQITVGAILIGIGLVFYLFQVMDEPSESLLLSAIGTAFLIAYFFQKKFGFLVPGCILLGLGIGLMEAGPLSGFEEPLTMGLGLGFCSILVLALTTERRLHWWPLIPGAILVASSVPRAGEFVALVFEHWPLLLAAVGAVLILAALLRSKAE